MKKQGKNYILSEEELKDLLIKASKSKVNPHDKLDVMLSYLDDDEGDIDDLVSRILTKKPSNTRTRRGNDTSWSTPSPTFSGCRLYGSRC